MKCDRCHHEYSGKHICMFDSMVAGATLPKVSEEDLFADECRKYTNHTDKEDYYHKEYESAVDHAEIDSQSEFARRFFSAGVKAAERLR